MAWLGQRIFSLKGFLILLVVLLVLLPFIQNWRLDMLRNDALEALEKKRGSRVIALIHRQEMVNVLGVPFMRYIDIEDSEES